MNDTEDPYQILNLDRSCSLDDVKRAYYYIVKLYQPNQGGNSVEFQRFQDAYRQIIAQFQQGALAQHNGETDYYRQQQNQAAQNMLAGGKFNQTTFNQAFNNSKSDAADGYIYNIDDSFTERTKSQFMQQHSQITAEAESVKPMFASGGFNNNVFNRVFTQMKAQYEEDTPAGPPEPQAPPGTAMIAYSDVNKIRDTTNLSRLGYAAMDVYDKSHKNPTEFDKDMMSGLSRMNDITKEDRMSTREAQNRLSTYRNMPLEYNKVPLNTDPSANIPGQMHFSQMHPAQSKQQQSGSLSQMQVPTVMDRIMELQRPLYPPSAPTPAVNSPGFMIYPTNSHQEPHRKETAGFIRDMGLHQPQNDFLPQPLPQMQMPMQMPLRPQVPPQMNHLQMQYHQYQQNDRKNTKMEKKLRDAEETVKIQQKLINQLTKKRK